MSRTNLALAILLILLAISSWLYVGHKDKKLEQFKQEAQRQQGLSEAYHAAYTNLKPRLEAIRSTNATLLSTIHEQQKKLDSIKVPNPPGPAPSDPAVKHDLEAAGLTFTWANSTQLTTKDGSMIWEWQQEAQNGPVLRQKIMGYEEMVGTQRTLLEGKEREIGVLNDRDRFLTLANDAQTKRAESLNQAVKACESARKGERIKWWLKVAGAGALGYVVGKNIK